jgi:UDP-N-acetyl-2-amino-2-deoxyglucuronate dehydrogenase
MLSDKVAVGIVGAGFIADYHVNGLKTVSGAEIVAIADSMGERAASKAKSHGIPSALDDYRKLLGIKDIDAVVIATPDHTHEEIAIAAAEAGKAILLQKPMAMTVESCRSILAKANASRVDLQVSWMHRYMEEVVYTRELLNEGRLGDVFVVRVRNAVSPSVDKAWYYRKGLVAGGAVLQLGVHGIDLAQHMFGAIGSVQATTDILMKSRKMPDGEVIVQELEDHAFAHYKFASGALGTHEITSCEAQGTDRFSMEIYCANGTVLLRTNRGPLALWAPDVLGREGWMIPALPAIPFGARHHAWWIDIVRGRRPSESTAEDAVRTQIIADAIYSSAQTGTRQKVQLDQN